MSEALQELVTDGPVVFYDGECGLCDRTVRWLIVKDRHRRLRFATLQGETAARVLGPPEGPPGEWTLKLADERGVHERSTAVLRATARVGGVWKSAGLLLAVPRSVRDGIYRFVARNRRRWFRQPNSCMIPTLAQRERFLP